MTKKRNKLEVVYDILKVINDKNRGIKPTHIMYKSNLSHQMMMEYLRELIGKEFITESKYKRGKIYLITKKGLEYLNKYKLIIEFTNAFGLGS